MCNNINIDKTKALVTERIFDELSYKGAKLGDMTYTMFEIEKDTAKPRTINSMYYHIKFKCLFTYNDSTVILANHLYLPYEIINGTEVMSVVLGDLQHGWLSFKLLYTGINVADSYFSDKNIRLVIELQNNAYYSDNCVVYNVYKTESGNYESEYKIKEGVFSTYYLTRPDTLKLIIHKWYTQDICDSIQHFTNDIEKGNAVNINQEDFLKLENLTNCGYEDLHTRFYTTLFDRTLLKCYVLPCGYKMYNLFRNNVEVYCVISDIYNYACTDQIFNAVYRLKYLSTLFTDNILPDVQVDRQNDAYEIKFNGKLITLYTSDQLGAKVSLVKFADIVISYLLFHLTYIKYTEDLEYTIEADIELNDLYGANSICSIDRKNKVMRVNSSGEGSTEGLFSMLKENKGKGLLCVFTSEYFRPWYTQHIMQFMHIHSVFTMIEDVEDVFMFRDSEQVEAEKYLIDMAHIYE